MDSDFGGAWPECLGVFDEESCRYFLLEVGSRTVPNFPFSFGMEEVYSLILTRYGLSNTPDVTSLLQELLEDDRNAAGLGDDGDVWRSWRHGWRHRNDDSLNPFIAHVGSVLLPPPTNPQIRKLKANNFLTNQDRGENGSHSSLEQEEQLSWKPCKSTSISSVVPFSSSPMKKSLDVTQPNNRVEQNENNSYCNRYSTCTVRFDSALTTVSEAIEPSEIGCAQLQASRDYAFDDEDHALKLSAKDDSKGLYRLNSTAIDLSRFTDASGTCVTEGCESSPAFVSDDLRPSSFEENHNNNATVSPLARKRSLLKSRRCPPKPDFPRNITRATEISNSQATNNAPRSELNKRAQNREARLIDGTIFVPRSRRSKTVSQQQFDAVVFTEKNSRRSSGRLSWSPTGQGHSLRSKWTHELRHMFHRDRQLGIAPENKKHRSVPASSQTCSSHGYSNMSDNQNKSSVLSPNACNPVQSHFGLDGASDVPAQQSLPLNVNKPLPLNPEDVVRSMSSRTQTLTSRYSDSSSNLPSAASTSSTLSKNSSRKDLRGPNHEFLHSAMPPQHELPPIREVSTNLKCMDEPQKPPTATAAHVSYSSMARANPFADDEASPPLPSSPSFSVNSPYRSPEARDHQNVVKSKELSNTNFSKPAQLTGPQTPCPEPAPSQITRSQSTRGRKSRAADSSTAGQNNGSTPKSPTKRSRSPIKRFLGLVKSSSANKLEEKETPVRTNTPGSGSKKDSLKKWGDRIRYGFLTADQEQLRQEELLEQHCNESMSSTPQKSTFPISLDPPLQAKVQSEIELILSVTANRYLLHEAKAGRLSAESIANAKELWEKMNRPQVVEFLYDATTQHSLVMANMDRVRLHGDAAKDAIAINSTMRGWKTLAREISIRTFCSPDSVIRKHLHDAHRVLELLGAPLVTFLAYEDMQLKTLSTISHRQKERMDRRRAGSHSNTFSHSRTTSSSSQSTTRTHRRNFSEGSHQQHDYSDYPITALQMDKISFSPSPAPFPYGKVRKPTGAEGAVMSLPTNLERSRDRYKHGGGHTSTDTKAYLRAGKVTYGVKEI